MEIRNNSFIGSENQQIFFNTEKIVGIQSLSIQNQAGLAPLKYAGINTKQLYYLPNSEQSAQVSINALLLQKDYFLNHVISNDLFNTYILLEQTDSTHNYSVLSGYATSYSCQYSFGQIPTISFDYIGINNAGGIGNFNSHQTGQLYTIRTGNHEISNVLVSDGGSVTLNFTFQYLNTTYNDTNFENNRVISYDINVQSQKVPVYNMGDRLPKRIQQLFPTIVNCSFTVELSNYNHTNLRQFPETGIIRNLELIVNNHNSSDNIITYNFNNLNLLNQEYVSQQNENVTMKLSFGKEIFN